MPRTTRAPPLTVLLVPVRRRRLARVVRRFYTSTWGISAPEYALLVALVALTVVGAWALLGRSASAPLDTAGDALAASTPDTNGAGAGAAAGRGASTGAAASPGKSGAAPGRGGAGKSGGKPKGCQGPDC